MGWVWPGIGGLGLGGMALAVEEPGTWVPGTTARPGGQWVVPAGGMKVEPCGATVGGLAEGGVLACGTVACGVLLGIVLTGAAMPVMATAPSNKPDRAGRYLMISSW